jgi:diaminopimelate epimerase
VKFIKAHGAGNDFILIDDRELLFPSEDISLVEKLCHRRYGIGADGLILLQHSLCADYRMRYFNSDGREALLCGNGLRCFAAFVFHLGDSRESILIETKNDLIQTKRIDGRITTFFPPPKLLKNFPLALSSGIREVHFVDSGLPNAIFFTEEIEEEELLQFGREVRFHPAFAPDGVNVSVVECIDKNNIRIRTYERGVEAETLACGTAALSVAKVLAELKHYDRVVIYPTSEDPLEIDTKTWELTGPAKLVFEGEINLSQRSISAICSSP